jgi:Uma2 family endonuclease
MTTTLLSADEYFAMGDTLPRWTQLIQGEVIVSHPRLRHQRLVSHIHVSIVNWSNVKRNRGESPHTVDIRIDDLNVVAPDVLWFAEGRLPDDAVYLTILPDVAVEVRSPSTWRYDVGVKYSMYERAGLPELWLVDSEANTVLVFRRSSPTAPTFDVAHELGVGETLTSPLLPEFSLDVTDLFNR